MLYIRIYLLCKSKQILCRVGIIPYLNNININITLVGLSLMHKPTISNPSALRFFTPSPFASSTLTDSPATTPDESHSHQTSYFLRSNSSKKPGKLALNHQKSLDSVTMFGRVGGREYINVTPVPSLAQTPQSPNALYDTVCEVATKRMATFDYLRRA